MTPLTKAEMAYAETYDKRKATHEMGLKAACLAYVKALAEDAETVEKVSASVCCPDGCNARALGTRCAARDFADEANAALLALSTIGKGDKGMMPTPPALCSHEWRYAVRQLGAAANVDFGTVEDFHCVKCCVWKSNLDAASRTTAEPQIGDVGPITSVMGPPTPTRPTRGEETTTVEIVAMPGVTAVTDKWVYEVKGLLLGMQTPRSEELLRQLAAFTPQSPSPTHPASDSQAHNIDALNRVARPEEPARAAEGGRTPPTDHGSKVVMPSATPTLQDAAHVPPLGMEALDRVGLACRHGRDSTLCGECNARPPSPSQEGRADGVWPDFIAPPQYEHPAEGWEDPRLPDFRLIWRTAREQGYAVGLHGSMKRDVDLIAVPWTGTAAPIETLIASLCAALNAREIGVREAKPQGRVSVVLQIDAYVKHIDLSIMPTICAPQEGRAGELRACPFCKSAAIEHAEIPLSEGIACPAHVQCQSCGAMAPATIWNCRPGEESKPVQSDDAIHESIEALTEWADQEPEITVYGGKLLTEAATNMRAMMAELSRLLTQAIGAQHVSLGAAGIYVASRASVPERSQMWRDLRTAGAPIISTWIDEAGEGETLDFAELWRRCSREIGAAQGVVLFAADGDFPLKGALIEVGIALGMGKPVHVVLQDVAIEGRTMRPVGSWLKHPLVREFDTVEQAIKSLLNIRAPLEKPSGEAGVETKLLGRLRSLESHLGESHTVDDFDKETVHQAIIAIAGRRVGTEGDAKEGEKT